MKRAAIYNPYLDTVGGGERYTMTVAQILKKGEWDVEVAWRDPKILGWLEQRLGLDLSEVEVVPNISRGAGYDLIFWLSDGSIPTLLGRKNIIHFQTPFHNVKGRSLANRLKLIRVDKVVCNSKFTKRFVDKEYGVKSVVVYPPVAVHEFKPTKKEKIILSVGRFSQLQQTKRQDVLVDVFKKMCDKGLYGWRLILIGGSEVGAGDFVNNLKEVAKGYPIDILENLPFSEIKKFFAKAKIFWSAVGFGADESIEPEKVEHFGISVVEAMSAGCVPVVFKAGGHKETVKDKEDGFLWNTKDQLSDNTLKLICNERGRIIVVKKSKIKAQKFSQDRFEKEILQLVK